MGAKTLDQWDKEIREVKDALYKLEEGKAKAIQRRDNKRKLDNTKDLSGQWFRAYEDTYLYVVGPANKGRTQWRAISVSLGTNSDIYLVIGKPPRFQGLPPGTPFWVVREMDNVSTRKLLDIYDFVTPLELLVKYGDISMLPELGLKGEDNDDDRSKVYVRDQGEWHRVTGALEMDTYRLCW